MKLRSRDTGEETELVDGLVVGRLAECGLTIQDASVSRKHARCEQRGAGWWVVDLGSSNGTQQNGSKVGEFELRGGDLVTFGAVAFEAIAPRVAAAPPAELDLGEEIALEEDGFEEAAAVAEPQTAAAAEPAAPSRSSAADQERARLKRELRESKRSSGLGDLSQLSGPMQLLVALVAIAIVVGIVMGVRVLAGMIAPTAA